MRIFPKALLLGLALLSPMATAGPLTDLKNVYKSYGGAMNISKGAVLNSQRSGHYTVGGVSSRAPNRQLSPLSLSVPSYRMGCIGIDAHFGALSHIKSAELKRFLNSVLASGMNYGFMIGLETLCPMCKKSMDQLNRLASEINGLNVGSCETAAAAMGGVLPQTQATHDVLCPQLAKSSGFASDYAAGRQGCGVENKTAEVYQKASENEKLNGLLEQFMQKPGNLAWMILQDRNFSSRPDIDKSLRELVMTFSGSFIMNELEDGSKEFSILPSHASDKGLYEALLRGGETTLYQCDTSEKCLKPEFDKKFTVKDEESFTGLVKEHLLTMKEKLLMDEGEYSKEELKLIESTRKIPLLKALNSQATHSFTFEVIDLSQYAEIIAVDMLEDYINELIDMMRLGVKKFSIPLQQAKAFEYQLIQAKRLMAERRANVEKENSLAFDFIQKVRLIEQMTSDRLSSDLLQMAKWSSKQKGRG